MSSDPVRPTLTGTRGAMSTSHWLASASGMAVLERGGNAFDAAVAAAFVLHVVEPHQNGPGGDVSILLATAADGVQVICGQGPVPRTATVARFRELGLSLIPGTGLLAACVPGAVDAWLRVLEENGTMELEDVLGYAIVYAERGHPMSSELRQSIRDARRTFEEYWPTSAAMYLAGGVPPVGDLFTNVALAQTYRRLLARAKGGSREARIRAARRAWYQGFVAEETDAFVSGSEIMDESGTPYPGFLTAEDLSAFEARRESPTSVRYRDYVVYKTQTWGQGPVFLQQLTLLEGHDLTALGLNSPEYIHLVTECSKLAFADREAWYGDPDFSDVPLEALLSAEYAADRRRLVGREASEHLRPGSPGGRSPILPVMPGAAKGMATSPGGSPAKHSEGDTCFVAATDASGNTLSAAPSGGWLHGSPVIPSLGFPLGTRAQMLWLQEGLPNSLEPGKRPRTTLTPTIAMTNGGRWVAFGTPGGDQQDQWSLLFFLAHVDFGLDLHAGIDTPVFHNVHAPSSFYPRDSHPTKVVVEARIPTPVVEDLSRRGHEVEIAGSWDLARTCAVYLDHSRGVVGAGASMRGIQAHSIVR